MSTERVTLSGVGEAIVVLEAPLSGRQCVLYQLELRRWQRWLLDGWRGRPWRETVWSRFVLWSGATPLLVEPARASLSLRVGERGRLVAAPLCRRLGRPTTSGTLACNERRIEVGGRITVSGVVQRFADARGEARGYRLAPSTTLLVADAIEGH